MIIALAGRRIDAENTEQIRFPLNNVQLVSHRIEEVLTNLGCKHLFCSGACGTDLLALSIAKKLKICRTMILPFHHRQFRSISVVDRPGNWGVIFDQFYRELNSKHHIHTLDLNSDDASAYKKTNNEIIRAAIDYARHNDMKEGVNALIAWEGQAYGQNDTTGLFLEQANSQGLKVFEILTL